MVPSDFWVKDRLFSPRQTINLAATTGFVEVLAITSTYIVLGRPGRDVGSGVRWDQHVINACVGSKPEHWQLVRYVHDAIVLPVGA